MAEISEEETQRRFVQAMEEMNACSRFNLTRTDKNNANFKIKFKPESQMRTALGLYWRSSGEIWIGPRKVNLNDWNSRVAQTLLQHEVGHGLGLKHSDNKRDVMNTHLNAKSLSIDEVLTLQSKSGGSPAKIWIPADRAMYGAVVREFKPRFDKLKSERKRLLARRDLIFANLSSTKAERERAQDAVIKNNEELTVVSKRLGQASRAWFQSDTYWRSRKVPMRG